MTVIKCCLLVLFSRVDDSTEKSNLLILGFPNGSTTLLSVSEMRVQKAEYAADKAM